MIILDAHLPPTLAVWITETFETPCFSAQFLDLRHAEDEEIFLFLNSNLGSALALLETNDLVEITGQ